MKEKKLTPVEERTTDSRTFKYLLQRLGMTYDEFARRARVDVRSVKRWASEEYVWDVPDELVQAIVEPEIKRQKQAVETALQIVEETEAEHGEAHVIRLPWYVSERELGFMHPGDTRTVKMANTDTIRLQAALEALGYETLTVSPDETGVRPETEAR